MLEMYSGLANSIETSIKLPINATDTEILVNDTANIPEPPNLLVIGGALPGAETVKLIVVDGKTLTVERGFQGVAKAWSAGAPIARNFTEYDYRAMIENIAEVDQNENEHRSNNVASSDMEVGVHGLRLKGKNLGFFDTVDKVWRSAGMNTVNFNYSVNNANNVLSLPWTAKATPDAETVNGCRVAVGTDIYILGSSTVFKKYNTITNTYSTLAHCSVTVNGIVYAAGLGARLAVMNGEIYAFGVGGSGTFIAKYNITLNTWSLSAPLINSGQFASTAHYDGFIYMFGNGIKCNKYEIATKTWFPIADCPINANYSKAVAYDGSIYLFGGSTAPYIKIYRYDTPLNIWEEVFTCSYSLQYSSVVLVDRKVYIFGSANNTGVYDIVGNTLTNLSNAPNNLNYSSAAYDGNGLIYVVGSSDTGFNQLNVLNITSKVWLAAKTPCPVDARYGSTVFHNGHLNVMVDTRRYRYNVQADTWVLSSAIGVSLAYASATVVGDDIYYLGGNVAPYTHMFAYNLTTHKWRSFNHGLGTFLNTVVDCYNDNSFYRISTGVSPNFITERYDPQTVEWSQLANSIFDGLKACGKVLSDKLILACGTKTAVFSIADDKWTQVSDCPQDVNGYPCIKLSDTTMLVAKDAVLLLYNAKMNIWLCRVTSAATAITDSALGLVSGVIYSFFRAASVYYAKSATVPDESLLYYTISPVAALDEVYVDCGLTAVNVSTTEGQSVTLRQKNVISKDGDLIIAFTGTTPANSYVQGFIKR